MPHAQQWLAQVLVAESRHYRKSFRAARTEASPGHVHDLRTATRRVRAALSLAAALHPQAKLHELQAELRGPFKACGRLRDLQLMKRVVGRQRGRHQELGALFMHVAALLEQQRRRLGRRLANGHPRRLERRLRGLAAEVEDAAPNRAAGAKQSLVRALKRSERDMVARQRLATAADPVSLHRARLAFKARRYQLELVRPVLSPLAADMQIRRLRRLQAALGAITDRTALLRVIDEFAGVDLPSRAALRAFRQRIEGERQRLIARYLPEIAPARRARSSASSR